MIERNGFFFFEKQNIVYIWFGKPHDPESDYVGSFDKVFLPSVIAGLTALKFIKK